MPSDEEWQQLEIAAGMSKSDAEQEMFRSNISPYFLTTGSMGFEVQFAGMRKQGYFDNNGTEAQFWTSTKKNKPTYTRLFVKGDDRICKNLLGEAFSCSV